MSFNWISQWLCGVKVVSQNIGAILFRSANFYSESVNTYMKKYEKLTEEKLVDKILRAEYLKDIGFGIYHMDR